MTADIILYAGAVTSERVSGHDAAVIDVFRATSVMVEALHNGAVGIVPVTTLEGAFLMCEKFGHSDAVLGGERGMVRVEGFDLGNSPQDYIPERVVGKRVILSTTNGTRAVENARAAHNLYISSFLNMSAVCRKLAAGGRDAVLICSGRQDRFTTEDGLCAGAMASILAREYGYQLTDIAEVMAGVWEQAAGGDLHERLSASHHYNDLITKDFRSDIDFCLRRDVYDIVPAYRPSGEVTL